MAHLVAKQGLNIVLVARNKVKLDAVRRELLEKFPNVQVDVVVFDMATKMGEQPNSLTRIREVCHEITNTRDISLLFHFAGITEVMMIIKMMLVVAVFVVKFTRVRSLPGFVSNSRTPVKYA